MTPGRISIVLPYWERPEALRRGLLSMQQHYRDRDDVEFVVVDDGSPEQPARNVVVGASVGLDLKLVELPRKAGPLNPCVPINRGVTESTGEFIVLTNPETTHRMPVLMEMRDTIGKLGPKTYVHAGVWCPQSGAWHTHSSLQNAYHFCGMMRRDLWDEIGGFDEEYRLGYAFDDPDFLQRALHAGARIVWRDDLVVDHHQNEDAKHWRPRDEWDRNHDLFWKKWPNPKTINGDVFNNERLQNWR